MTFQKKLLLVALGILVFTLLLSSLLSLASFEKIYSSSLVATYEVSGKNLQRKIHSSLRFGKPLSQIVGMEELLNEVVKGNGDIQRIDVIAPDKTLLYSTATQPRGTPSLYQAEYPDFGGGQETQVTTELIRGRYVTFLPLLDRSKEVAGYLNLEFPREVVYRRLRTVAWDNVLTLSPIILGAVLVLVLAIHRLVSRPINSRLAKMIASTRPPERIDPNHLPPRPVASEPDRKDGEFADLHRAVDRVIVRAHRELEQLGGFENSLTSLQQELVELGNALARLQELPDLPQDRREALQQHGDELQRLLGEALGSAREPQAHIRGNA